MNSVHTSILLAMCIFTLTHPTQSAAIAAAESDLVALGAEAKSAQVVEHPAAAATDLLALENDGVALESALPLDSAAESSRPVRQIFYPSYGSGYYNGYRRYGYGGGYGGYGYPFFGYPRNYGAIPTFGSYNPYYGYPRPIYG